MKQALIASILAIAGISSANASEWAGSSVSMQSTANGFVCRAGAVQLSIDGEAVNGSGNGISLAGRISKNGSVSLEGGSGAKRISFTGKKTGENIRGGWMEALTGCGGTWRAQMVAAESPPAQPASPQDGSDDASIFMEQPDEVPPEESTEPGDTIPIPPKTEQP